MLVTGALLIVVGFTMHRLRRIASRQHRKLVAMSWAEIAEMKKRQGPIERRTFGKMPSPRGGTTVMYVGAGLSMLGVLLVIAGY